jgi:hypothetical protein
MNPYVEKLSPAPWLIAAVGLFVPASLLIFFPLSLVVGTITGLGLWWGSVAILWVLAPRIVVDESHIRAGRAHIEHRFVSSIEGFRKEQAREQRGVKLDARAWLVLRPWVDPVVKITLSDPDDPTPYWLVSTKNPERLISAWKNATLAT